MFCRGGRIRTCGPLVPNQVRYRTAPRPEQYFYFKISKTTSPVFCNNSDSKSAFSSLICSLCDPTGTRTPNRQLRRLMLYPVELSDPVHHFLFTSTYQICAERGGFEPPVQNDPYDSLANYWFKPLTHLSSVFSLKSPFLPEKECKYKGWCKTYATRLINCQNILLRVIKIRSLLFL